MADTVKLRCTKGGGHACGALGLSFGDSDVIDVPPEVAAAAVALDSATYEIVTTTKKGAGDGSRTG